MVGLAAANDFRVVWMYVNNAKESASDNPFAYRFSRFPVR
jgi:hypothetical protein